jgi:hypothetical protein
VVRSELGGESATQFEIGRQLTIRQNIGSAGSRQLKNSSELRLCILTETTRLNLSGDAISNAAITRDHAIQKRRSRKLATLVPGSRHHDRKLPERGIDLPLPTKQDLGCLRRFSTPTLTFR